MGFNSGFKGLNLNKESSSPLPNHYANYSHASLNDGDTF